MSNNGHGPTTGPHRKRTIEEFTFTSTGVTVKYTRVPLQLVIDFESGWRRKHPAPQVPQNTVDIGGVQKVIDNPSDPDYQAELALHEATMHNASYRYMLKKAIVLSDEDRAEVDALRKEVADEGSELDESTSEWVFLFNIASTDPNEIGEFQSAVLRLSQPSKEAIDDAKARFPDTVPGA